ncbi:hypothetical protein [Streptomyces sp. NPDC002889]|uniref:hypothetical protein n=1 Tax=Streptomyces sp. NPDC002889 TaxID=3364669 RepID=UPI003689166E
MAEAVKQFDPALLRMMRADEANWDARTPVHLAGRFHDVSPAADPARWFASCGWASVIRRGVRSCISCAMWAGQPFRFRMSSGA